MYNLTAFDTFQMQMLCAFLFFSSELKYGFVRIQIRVFDCNMFRTEFGLNARVIATRVYHAKYKVF